MKLGFLMGYSGKQIHIPIDLIKHAESLGYDSVWTAEAYGSDAVTVATWVLAQTEKIRVGTAIMQMPARTPAMCAMTSMSLSQMSNNRLIVGLGASGPQVVEGWHGVPYGKPITRTREYIQIMRKIMAREGPVEFDGSMYQLPNKGEGTTGLGKPLKSILEANNDIPIYTASITPAGLKCAAEVADGVFPVWMDPDKYSLFADDFNAGFEKAGNGKSLKREFVVPWLDTQQDITLLEESALAKSAGYLDDPPGHLRDERALGPRSHGSLGRDDHVEASALNAGSLHVQDRLLGALTGCVGLVDDHRPSHGDSRGEDNHRQEHLQRRFEHCPACDAH